MSFICIVSWRVKYSWHVSWHVAAESMWNVSWSKNIERSFSVSFGISAPTEVKCHCDHHLISSVISYSSTCLIIYWCQECGAMTRKVVLSRNLISSATTSNIDIYTLGMYCKFDGYVGNDCLGFPAEQIKKHTCYNLTCDNSTLHFCLLYMIFLYMNINKQNGSLLKGAIVL